jgi:hypothetical protein
MSNFLSLEKICNFGPFPFCFLLTALHNDYKRNEDMGKMPTSPRRSSKASRSSSADVVVFSSPCRAREISLDAVISQSSRAGEHVFMYVCFAVFFSFLGVVFSSISSSFAPSLANRMLTLAFIVFFPRLFSGLPASLARLVSAVGVAFSSPGCGAVKFVNVHTMVLETLGFLGWKWGGRKGCVQGWSVRIRIFLCLRFFFSSDCSQDGLFCSWIGAVSFVNVHTMVLENPRVSSLEVGGGDEEGICTSLICENQDFSVFACLFFPLTAVRMAYLLMDVELLAW